MTKTKTNRQRLKPLVLPSFVQNRMMESLQGFILFADLKVKRRSPSPDKLSDFLHIAPKLLGNIACLHFYLPKTYKKSGATLHPKTNNLPGSFLTSNFPTPKTALSLFHHPAETSSNSSARFKAFSGFTKLVMSNLEFCTWSQAWSKMNLKMNYRWIQTLVSIVRNLWNTLKRPRFCQNDIRKPLENVVRNPCKTFRQVEPTSFRLPFRLRCSSRASESKIVGLTIGPNEQYLASNGKHAHAFVDRASACLLLKIGNPYDERDHQN